jgi:hypothetical protein
MADLDVTLATVRERIGKYQRPGIGEQDTKAALIVPVLRALGWDVEDLDEVKLEYRRRTTDNPVDYALFVSRTARLFVEAKALGANLADPKWANQMLGYAMAAGVEWVALTDGNEYRIYNSHAAVPVEQKLFRRVLVADPATMPQDTLALLSKAQMADHLIDELWKAHFIDRQIRATLEGLFGAEPDPSLVRLIRSRIPALSPAEVRAGLGRLRATFDFPGAPPIPPLVASLLPVAPGPGRIRQAPQPAPTPTDPATAAGQPSGAPATRSPLYLMTPVKDEPGATVRETLESLLGQGVYVFGDRTPGRAKIQVGDRICFYSSGVGVVADAEITSAAELRGVHFAKDAARFPWAFSVGDVRYYFDSPVVIDAALRSRLDAFVKHGHDPNGFWSFLVQGTRYVTAHDFAVLTGR